MKNNEYQIPSTNDSIVCFKSFNENKEIYNPDPNKISVYVKGWTAGKELREWNKCTFVNKIFKCTPKRTFNFWWNKEDTEAQIAVVYHNKTLEGGIDVDLFRLKKVFSDSKNFGYRKNLETVYLKFDYTIVKTDLFLSILDNGNSNLPYNFFYTDKAFLYFNETRNTHRIWPEEFTNLRKDIEYKTVSIVKELFENQETKEDTEENIEKQIKDNIISYFKEELKDRITITENSVRVDLQVTFAGLDESDQQINKEIGERRNLEEVLRGEDYTQQKNIRGIDRENAENKAKAKGQVDETIIKAEGDAEADRRNPMRVIERNKDYVIKVIEINSKKTRLGSDNVFNRTQQQASKNNSTHKAKDVD